MKQEYQVTISFEERISSKTGKPFETGVIKLSDGVEKFVFFNKAEKALLVFLDNKKIKF